MKIVVKEKNYELIKNINNCFDEEEFTLKCTDYFLPFDYIVGDYAYGKLRLKGFYDKNNKNCKELNNYAFLEKYLKENCAFGCKYFVLKKMI